MTPAQPLWSSLQGRNHLTSSEHICRPLTGTVCGPFSVLADCVLSFCWSYFTLLMGENLPKVPRGVQQRRRDTLSGHVRTLRVKMVLLGSSGVGKSSLALRFGREEFRTTSPTVGCEYVILRYIYITFVTITESLPLLPSHHASLDTVVLCKPTLAPV